MITPLRAALGLLAVGGLVAALGFGLNHDPRALPIVVINKTAPQETLRRLGGGRVRIPFAGRPTLLNVWASWCTECKQEHPLLVAAERRFGRRIAFAGLIYQDSVAGARGFLRARDRGPNGSYPNLLDPGSRAAIDYGVYGVPETFFIDRRGVIRAKVVGRMSPQTLEQGLAAISR